MESFDWVRGDAASDCWTLLPATGPPADLPPAVCVVVDNTPAPESVANQLVAALALVTHVLDALEVPCAVRRLYATQGSPFLEVKSTDKLMTEVCTETCPPDPDPRATPEM